MTARRGDLRSALGTGVAFGLSAWSAYAATEFVFSSLLFSFARPYAGFTPWHWELTWLLVGAFALFGAVCGALAGLAVFFFGHTGEPCQFQQAATLSLAAAFFVNLLASPRTSDGWFWLAASSALFIGILLAGLRSDAWRIRFGYLTNPWVFSGLLLGIGQEAVVRNMGTAEQFGSHIRVMLWLLILLLFALAIGSVVIGRIARARIQRRRWIEASSWAFAPAAAIVLVAVSELASGTQTPKAQAATVFSEAGKPNVMLVVMDTVRADHLGLDGYVRPNTPHLRQLALDAAVYTHAMAASNFTLTSHASLFTGLYPSWHGAYCRPPEAAYGSKMEAGVPTLAELLRERGYFTVGVAANLYMRDEFGLVRGFEAFEIPRPVPVLTAENWYLLRRPARRLISYGFDTSQFDRLYSRSQDIEQRLVSILDRRGSSDAPFFAFLNFMDAHFPYVPPAPYDTLFPGKNRQLTGDDLDLEQQAIARGEAVPANYRPHTISQYDGGIAYMDAQIGSLVDWLKRRNAYEDTMIIVTSDHGEAFGERNLTGHANSPYQNLLHVPLIVKYPFSAKKGSVDSIVSLIDVAPTILQQLGLALPPNMQGRSLLEPPQAKAREIFSETFPCAVLGSLECPRGCIARAVFSWPYKFVTSTNGRRQLFDISRDPDETRDLYPSMIGLGRELNGDLHAWMKTFPSHPRQAISLDPEALRRLKSLGYVQ
ncbi:MAG: sulfatase [Acidobacteriia bacterium]|nr:sulfatase [Terriglobia bacterium]